MAGFQFGANADQLAALKNMPQQQREALIRGEWLPERLSELNRNREAQENLLRSQAAQAYQMAYQPVGIQGKSTPAAAASLTANVLRMMGGMALGKMRENELANFQGESSKKFEDLMTQGHDATDAVKNLEQARLQAQALRELGGDNNSAPWMGVPYR